MTNKSLDLPAAYLQPGDYVKVLRCIVISVSHKEFSPVNVVMLTSRGTIITRTYDEPRNHFYYDIHRKTSQ